MYIHTQLNGVLQVMRDNGLIKPTPTTTGASNHVTINGSVVTAVESAQDTILKIVHAFGHTFGAQLTADEKVV